MEVFLSINIEATVTIILAIILLLNDKCSNSAKEKAGGILATGVVIFLLPYLKKAFSSRSAGTISVIELCLQFAAGVTGAILAILLLNEKECDSGLGTWMLVTSIISSIVSLYFLYKHYTLRPGKIQRYNAMSPRGGPGVPTDSWGNPLDMSTDAMFLNRPRR